MLERWYPMISLIIYPCIRSKMQTKKRTNYIHLYTSKCSSKDTGMFVWWPLTDQSFSYAKLHWKHHPELGWSIAKKWWSHFSGLSLDPPWKNTTLHCGFFAWQVLTLNAWGSYFHWSHRGWGSHFLDLEIQSMVFDSLRSKSWYRWFTPHAAESSPIFSWSDRQNPKSSSQWSMVESCQIPIFRGFPNPKLYGFVPSSMSVLVKFRFLRYPLIN